jgi:hypothetical protein
VCGKTHAATTTPTTYHHRVQQLQFAFGRLGRAVLCRSARDTQGVARAQALDGSAQVAILAQTDAISILISVLEIHVTTELSLDLALQTFETAGFGNAQLLHIPFVGAEKKSTQQTRRAKEQ